MISRSLTLLLQDPELAGKMIILAGPRQVGKTTLGKLWGKASSKGSVYVNWDDEKTRRLFRKDANFFESQAREIGKGCRLVFDEIHKIPQWKTLLKGYFDTLGSDFEFLVTGSARLEILQKAGDSMLGRYHLLHLYPLTPAEAEKRPVFFKPLEMSGGTIEKAFEEKPCSPDVVSNLLHFSGFPEIFLKQSERSLRLWQREYFQRLIKEDLRDLSRLTDLFKLEQLIEILPARVGAPLSLNSLREDLACSHEMVRSMVRALEKLYVTLLVSPYSKRVPNALRKEKKLYFIDWTLVPDPGARFENFMAVQLKAFCHLMNDGGWHNLDLFYVRDKQKREVDFLITNDHVPFFLVEAKLKPETEMKNLDYFAGKFNSIPRFQVVAESGVFKKSGKNAWMVSINRFINLLFGSPA